MNSFAVDAAMVRRQRFPQWPAFSAESSPDTTAIGEFVTDEAATLEAKLLQESITASAIDDTASAAYAWCRKTLVLLVAIRVLEVATQADPELLKRYREERDARWKELDEKGHLALGGGVSAPAEQPNGPNHHIDEGDLEIDVPADGSAATSPFRRDDRL